MKTENFTEHILSRAIDKLGEKNENVMACVFKGNYNALSARFDNKITVEEGDCYVGQPYSGYALKAESKTDIVIAGILIRKEVFFEEYLTSIASDETGKKFSEILNGTRMRKAKMLLENTNLTIEKISEMTGFSATSNFYKAFKEFFGKTPKQLIIDS